MESHRQDGVGIPDELERLCHRVSVLRRGRLVAEQRAPDIDEHRLMELAHRSEDAA